MLGDTILRRILLIGKHYECYHVYFLFKKKYLNLAPPQEEELSLNICIMHVYNITLIYYKYLIIKEKDSPFKNNRSFNIDIDLLQINYRKLIIVGKKFL